MNRMGWESHFSTILRNDVENPKQHVLLYRVKFNPVGSLGERVDEKVE